MSEMTTSTKRPRASRSSAGGEGPARRSRAKPAAPAQQLTSEQRRALIAERAYLRAEQRGFQGGDPVSDWLASEREVDELLTRAG